MARPWNADASHQFWQRRVIHIITRDDGLPNRLQELQDRQETLAQRQQLDKTNFLTANADRFTRDNSPACRGLEIAENLEFWIKHGSWTFCERCHLLISEKLLPKYSRRPEVKASKCCNCSTGRYITPSAAEIPDILKMLSKAEIQALRPFTVHTGDYERMQHGYVKKTNIFRVSWSNLDVEEKIAQIQNADSRQRCQLAFRFLMAFERSSYRTFVERRADEVASGVNFNVYNTTQNKGVECALWPHLYPYNEWCETRIEDNRTRKSSKIAFISKVFSEIADYGLLFELLHFHYDRWVFKTVSGAIASARTRLCSPARSLESKTFSAGYWRWEHQYLLDAVRQFGFPSAFITISPYEWSFDFPPWVDMMRTLTGRGPTNLSGYETEHISHVLEQIVRGYICGSNNKRWSGHLFSYNAIPAYPNVQNYFYRFEFQQRGTVHLHLLVWLKNVSQIPYHLIRADIPWCNPEMAYLVDSLQRSDRSSLSVSSKPTNVTNINNKPTLQIHHPPDAFALHLRGYISSLLPSLKCKMDYQTTDGRGMLLRYVTSYVSKFADAYSNDALYSHHVSPFQAAYRHLREMHPLEPEMWLSLLSRKMSWSPSRRKKFPVPFSSSLNRSTAHQKYCRRPLEMEDLTLLQWLRQVDETKPMPKRYKDGVTLVATKFVSPLKDEYFFQQMLVHLKHRNIQAFHHPHFDRLPPQIKYFASASYHMQDIWHDDRMLQQRFTEEGHRDYYIATLICHINSLRDLFDLWKKQVITNTMLQNPPLLEMAVHPEQALVLHSLNSMFSQRDAYYNSITCTAEPSSDDEDLEVEMEQPPRQAINQSMPSIVNWRKFLLITGKPGTGKSHAMKLAIKDSIQRGRKILVATPTGYLATQYHSEFPNGIRTDTVHSSFSYPVCKSDRPTVNWRIADYDLVVIDELSMISKKIFEHVITTVNEVAIRPILVVTGDECQQQPIETVDNCTVPVESIMQHKQFYSLVNKHNLTFQHRTDDPEYAKFLNHIRHWRPSVLLLNKLQDGRILCPTGDLSDNAIFQALMRFPTATVLTVTRRATNRINGVLLAQLFKDEVPLAIVKCDCDSDETPLYHNMRVMVTQNRDKEHGVVNGQQARIHMIHNKTVFLRFPNGSIAPTYQVTANPQDGNTKTVYPFTPSYSLTICKAQGQTITTLIVWFDIPTPPAGCAYVALSRVKKLQNLYFLTPMSPQHVVPVSVTE